MKPLIVCRPIQLNLQYFKTFYSVLILLTLDINVSISNLLYNVIIMERKGAFSPRITIRRPKIQNFREPKAGEYEWTFGQ